MIDALKKDAQAWFETLRNQICEAFLAIETMPAVDDLPPQTFTRKAWNRPGGGGGVMSVMEGGRVFEKVGVNISTVHGTLDPKMKGKIPGSDTSDEFWASGISLVAHPRNPYVPIAHFNTRMITTSQAWFGGGGDLTPVFPNEGETQQFHHAFKDACDQHNSAYYPKFRKWCDEYFYLPHRNEPRGVGGIFFDQLASNDLQADFRFVQDVGKAFRDIYPAIIKQKLLHPYNDNDRAAQLKKRGRYVEFNLLHDRGTQFGLQTNGNIEAIFMSLPPLAAW